MRLADKILKQWEEQVGDYPGEAKDYEIKRTRAGYWQRSNGAWSWSLSNYKLKITLCGSQWPATECVRKGFVVRMNRTDAELWPIDFGN